jgi:hypothetical protein
LGFDADFVYCTGDGVAGWTYEDYVKPRLESGGMYAELVEATDRIAFTSCTEDRDDG